MPKLYSDCEQLMRRQLSGVATPKDCQNWLHELGTDGFCALGESIQRMGLGSANTLIVYYMPVWPFVLSAAMMASLANEEPSSALIKAAFGSTAAYRKFKSRTPNGFEPWPYLLQSAARQLELGPLVPPESVTAARPSRPAVRSKVTSRLAVAQFLRELLAGKPREEAAHRYGLRDSIAEEAIRCLDRHNRLHGAVRRLGAHGERGQRAILRSLHSAEGDQMLDALWKPSPLEVEALLKDLCATRLGSDAPRTADVIARLQRHLQCIPPMFNLLLRPTHAIADPAMVSTLAQLSARVRLGTPKAGRAPALFVYARGDHPNLVKTGRMTDLLRISALAVYVAIQMT
jgi:hypothetical protein